MDLYILLGVEREATLEDIKRAYRRLARRLHPDINPGDRGSAQRFRQIADAYETLSDPDRRRRYDTSGLEPVAGPPTVFGFEGFDFTVHADGSAASTFGDLFADVFRPREARTQASSSPRGADIHVTLLLPFEAAMRGGSHVVTVTRQEHCHDCGGRGRVPIAESRCASCKGAGVLKSARGHMVFSRPCARCAGSGVQTDTVCPSCAGRQVEMRTESLSVALPPGLDDGTGIRVAARGHAGADGGEPGDLFITVHVEAHPQFRREGPDLHVVVPIAIHEAAFGAKVEVPSLEGSARLRLPAGAQSGERFRLRERGVPSSPDRRRGDLVVEVRLVLPRVLDERSKELLREFGQIHAAEDVRQTAAPARDPDATA